MPRTRKTTQRSQPTPLEDIFTDSSTEDVSFGEPEESPVHNGTPAGPTALDRILNAAAQGANEAITEGGTLGLDPESVMALRRIGLFNRDRENRNPLGTANEILIGGGSALADLGLRAIAGTLEGGVSAIGQAARELGASQGMSERLKRDLRMLTQVFRRR